MHLILQFTFLEFVKKDTQKSLLSKEKICIMERVLLNTGVTLSWEPALKYEVATHPDALPRGCTGNSYGASQYKILTRRKKHGKTKDSYPLKSLRTSCT